MLAAASLFGCSDGDIEATQLAISSTALGSAERADAARYAPGELQQARARLTAARAAAQDGDRIAAHRFAHEAEADARLAEMTARANAAAEIAAALTADLHALQRRTGPAAADPGS